MSSGVELWLVRHGETAWSLSGAHTSRTDVDLTDKGRERAKRLREYLAGREFAAVLTSPMKRARETCAIAGFGDVAVIEPGLREWDYGVYEGKTTREVRERVPGWSVWTYAIVGGEALEHVAARADAVIEKALAAAGAPGKQEPRVLLFAHAHILRILAARWMGMTPVHGRHFALGTGSVSVLGYEREVRVISSWNREFGD